MIVCNTLAPTPRILFESRKKRIFTGWFTLTITVAALISPGAASGDCPTIPASPFWKNTFDFPDDPFLVPGGGNNPLPDWVKFTILACDPNVVYFQDCNEYPLHYQFGTEILSPIFGGMSQEEYEQATLHAEGQLAFLGALLLPPSDVWPPPPQIPEYGIQLVRYDAYTREQVRDLFAVVRAAVNADPSVQALYFPTPEQYDAAMEDSEWFAQQDPPIIISDITRWSPSNIVYSNGWALGTLKYCAGNQIANAYASGQLSPADILLTDAVPSEIPYFAGVLCMSPSTPNSHVALLCNTFSVPFAFLESESDVQRAQELVGRRIALRAYSAYDGIHIRLIDAESLTTQQVEEILALKAPPPIDHDPIRRYWAYGDSTEGLDPGDVSYFGGKASNYGILRRALPDRSPKAAAISFNLWEEFMDQTMPGGMTLREQIASILAAYPTYPPDMAALADDLDDIRDMIKDDTVFSPALQQAVITLLQDPRFGFDDELKIRFRSSTNVEDTEHFTGAGLYESFSGCLADDLDGDTVGPSICDPTENNERGVFRAIRKVFASFYNDNAFLERLRHGVDESHVGMAILVHHSFPDELELANGVAVYTKRSSTFSECRLVTQHGATSVTNPEGGAIAEEVSVFITSSGISPSVVQYSNLVPIGVTVLDWSDEYVELAQYLKLAAQEFERVTGKTQYTLDFEYKKVEPGGGALPAGGLVVKQIRELPQPSTERTITPFLINEPTEYVVEQLNSGGQLDSHRLKCLWRLETPNMWLTYENMQSSFYDFAAFDYIEGCRFGQMTGALSDWPEASYQYQDVSSWTSYSHDYWTISDWAAPRHYELITLHIKKLVSPAECPLLTISDFEHSLNITDDDGNFTYVSLFPRPGASPRDALQVRSFSGEIDSLGGRTVQIDTSYYLEEGTYVIGGYTSPLLRWDQTVINGLTTRPIVLTGYYSQSYQCASHYYSEHFVFEPRLEPGMPPDVLDELDALGVGYITADIWGSELQATINAYPSYGSSCSTPGDVDYDGDVDISDLAALLAAYGQCFGEVAYNPAVDFNQSECVELADLAELLGHYGM